MGKILIVFYTTYGHVYAMAKSVKEGVDKVDGCEGVLYQVGSKHKCICYTGVDKCSNGESLFWR